MARCSGLFSIIESSSYASTRISSIYIETFMEIQHKPYTHMLKPENAYIARLSTEYATRAPRTICIFQSSPRNKCSTNCSTSLAAKLTYKVGRAHRRALPTKLCKRHRMANPTRVYIYIYTCVTLDYSR